MKFLLIPGLLFMTLIFPLHAASFKPGRGISTDLWVTWPDENRWNNPDIMLPFPQWRQHLGQQDFEFIRKSGFDMVRLTIDPSVFLSPQTRNLREALLESVRQSIEIIQKSRLKVIVDLHSIPAGGNRSIGTMQLMEDDHLFDQYVGIVRQFAELVRDMPPEMVALELMNEPTSECEGRAAQEWTGKLKRLYAAARSTALDTTLVLSGACWGGAEGLVALDPVNFPDDNLLWSFHSYAPFILTHQGAGWTGDISPYATGLPYPPYGANAAITDNALKAIRKRVRAKAPMLRRSGIISFVEEELGKIDSPQKLAAVMARPFDLVAKWARRHNISPGNIFIGEFGMIRREYDQDFQVETKWRTDYYRDMIDLAEGHGFGWSLWSYGGAFGVIDAFEGHRAEPDILDMIGQRARR